MFLEMILLQMLDHWLGISGIKSTLKVLQYETFSVRYSTTGLNLLVYERFQSREMFGSNPVPIKV
jgi:hypothetical protein